MKSIIFIGTFILLSINFSCKKKSISFNTHYDFNISVPSQPFIPSGSEVTISEDIKLNDSRLSKTEVADLTGFTLQITDPTGKTFDFCREIHLSISTETLPEIEVAMAANIDPSTSLVNFKVTNVNIAEYLKNNMKAHIRLLLTQGFKEDLKVYGNMTFKIQQPLN